MHPRRGERTKERKEERKVGKNDRRRVPRATPDPAIVERECLIGKAVLRFWTLVSCKVLGWRDKT